MAEVTEKLGVLKDKAMSAAKAVVTSEGGQQGSDQLLEVLRQDYECPITCDLMVDPVLAEDGYSYERMEIETWLRERRTSPMTNLPIGTALLPNRALKSAIERWKEMTSGRGP